MRVLLLLPQLPYPPQKGGAIRAWHFLRWLAQKHEVSLLTFAGPDGVPPEVAQLCAQVRTVPPPIRTTKDRLRDLLTSPLPDLALRLRSPAYEKALADWLGRERFDVLQAESLEMSLAWLRTRALLPLGRRPWAVLDELNAEYQLQWRAFRTDLAAPRRWPLAGYSLVQTARLRTYEASVCRVFERVVVVSNEDAAALRALQPNLAPVVLSNGVDCEYFALDARTANRPPWIVFTGTMDFRPNVDAAVWFARSILPLVRRAVPDAVFVIVGANPSPVVQRLAGTAGVLVTGRVPDVRPYLATGAVYAVPMRIGGGVRLKVLEAMAAGLPVVSTGLGCSGTDAEPGRHYLRADAPDRFAELVIEVLKGRRDCRPMVAEARRLMEERYDWRRLCPALEDAYPMDRTAARAR